MCRQRENRCQHEFHLNTFLRDYFVFDMYFHLKLFTFISEVLYHDMYWLMVIHAYITVYEVKH